MNYSRPSVNILASIQEREKGKRIRKDEVDYMRTRVIGCLQQFDCNVEVVDSYATPISIVIKIKLGYGFSAKKIEDIKENIEVACSHEMIIIQDVNDLSIMALVFSYRGRSIVGLREIIDNNDFYDSASPLLIAAGIDLLGNKVYLNLDDTPHLLIEGTTGSGKTIFLDDILMSIIYKSSPEQVRFLLIDPKKVDLCPYEGIQHLIMPIITNMKLATSGLKYVEKVMKERYEMLAETGAKDIDKYNEVSDDGMSHIVVIIDEYKEVSDFAEAGFTECVANIASNGRKVGVHLIVSTQTASSEVIPSAIKANIGLKVVFSSATTVKGPDGKIRLLGSGDVMIYDKQTYRAQASYVSYEEIQKVVKSVRHRNLG